MLALLLARDDEGNPPAPPSTDIFGLSHICGGEAVDGASRWPAGKFFPRRPLTQPPARKRRGQWNVNPRPPLFGSANGSMKRFSAHFAHPLSRKSRCNQSRRNQLTMPRRLFNKNGDAAVLRLCETPPCAFQLKESARLTETRLTEPRPIRLLIAEDQAMTRKAFAALLALEPDLEVVATAADGAEAVRAARAFKPDVVLMDIKMPRMDGIAATRALMAENPQARVIVLTTFETDDLVFEAILAGARAYLLKDAEESEILSAIRAVARGEPRLSPSIAGKILDEFRRVKGSTRDAGPEPEREPLTEREKDVLAQVAAGKGNREIARDLGLAEGTVKNHVSTILAKLHLRSRTELAVKVLSRR
jgi:DNA-binding NarL/FixJ family response regulator